MKIIKGIKKVTEEKTGLDQVTMLLGNVHIFNQEMSEALRKNVALAIVFACYALGSKSNAILYGTYRAQAKYK